MKNFRLLIKTKCLDVVYQPNAVKWLTEFVCLPHQKEVALSHIEAVKSRTKKQLIRNWEQILEGKVVYKTFVSFDFDFNKSIFRLAKLLGKSNWILLLRRLFLLNNLQIKILKWL